MNSWGNEYEKGWGQCVVCGSRRPSVSLVADTNICIEEDWCLFAHVLRKHPDMVVPLLRQAIEARKNAQTVNSMESPGTEGSQTPGGPESATGG